MECESSCYYHLRMYLTMPAVLRAPSSQLLNQTHTHFLPSTTPMACCTSTWQSSVMRCWSNKASVCRLDVFVQAHISLPATRDWSWLAWVVSMYRFVNHCWWNNSLSVLCNKTHRSSKESFREKFTVGQLITVLLFHSWKLYQANWLHKIIKVQVDLRRQ